MLELNLGDEWKEERAMVKARRVDLTGQRFGRLVALRPVGQAKNGNALWLCQCDCGNRCVSEGYRMRRGVTKSCGCLRRERSREAMLSNPATLAQMHAPLRIYDAGKPMRMSKTNKSGVTGVSWDAPAQRWMARLMVRGQLVLNRTYDSFEEAVAARQQAEHEHGVAPRKPRKKHL